MLSNINLFFLQELARRADQQKVSGDFVECGVYRGGSAGLLGYEAMRSVMRRDVWLFDAFSGMPQAGAKDDDHSRSIHGSFVGSQANTRRLLSQLGVPESRAHLIVGWFNNTFPTIKPFPVSLLHVDCDFYDPVKLVLETFYDCVQPTGYVVLNDYGSFLGCRTAVDEFLATRGPAIELIQIDQDAFYFQKPAPVDSATDRALSVVR